MKTSRTRPGNSLRIIGGQWRSRKLQFPDVDGLRPTADRVRETLFNWLQEPLPRAACLDLFAGSGACGMEALSRGARHVCFVEKSPLALQAIRHNLSLLKASDHSTVCDDALTWLARKDRAGEKKFDIVFIDPPFASELLERSAFALEASGLLQDHALVYVEFSTDKPLPDLPANWVLRKSKRAGKVQFHLFERQTPESAS